MRLRNIPGADEVIRNCDWVIKEPADKKENGIQYLEMKIRSISKLGWEKGSLSLRWQREIHRSTTSESSAIRAFFCVLYRKRAASDRRSPAESALSVYRCQ